jgi:hypothetical protein
VLGHIVRVTLNAEAPNLLKASGAIGSEDKGKHLRHDVIEFLTGFGIRVLGTVGTGRVFRFDATATHLAPLGLFIGMAAWAPFTQICPTGSAIETTVRDQAEI